MVSPKKPEQDFHLGPPPSSAEPEQMAQYFLDMLDAFAQAGTPEAKQVRSSLIQAVVAYREAEDKQAAQEEFKITLLGIELGVTDLLFRSTKRVHEQFKLQSRRVGTASAAGKGLRSAAEGFGLVVLAMETMFKAAKANDDALRKAAHEKLEQAREALKGLEKFQ